MLRRKRIIKYTCYVELILTALCFESRNYFQEVFLTKGSSFMKNKKKGYHIHHIDWNHKNNSPHNLISVPPVVHKVIHQRGVNERWEVIKLLKIYELSKSKSREEIEEYLRADENLSNISVDVFYENYFKAHLIKDNQNINRTKPISNSQQLSFEFGED